MVIIVRTDLKMGKGKIGAMCGHAAIGAFQQTTSTVQTLWALNGSTKIVLAIDSLDELLQLEVRARALNLISYKVVDAGLTQVKIGSTTALAIGPNASSSIDEITMHLKLLR